MHSHHTPIHQLLNLKTNESIGTELADRQLEVIRRSFEYLNKPENNIIYIADEVGLGKTFIAIGIALLFRHAAQDAKQHKTLIIVPKKNLQDKWYRELNNFVTRNYLPDDHIKKELTARIDVHDRLVSTNPAKWIDIHRMTAFSALATPRNSASELKDHLIRDVFQEDPFASEIIETAWEKGYFERDHSLRKLVACLLNASSPPLDCLIVDEAHNYKYGRYTALRNILTTTFLGASKEEDILKDFPELEQRMKFPLAQKIICLSATPKDRNLMEIANQFSCFTNWHILQDAPDALAVKDLLPRFLIRGNLNYKLDGTSISRNQARLEHRKGNINKHEEAKKLQLEDDFASLFWQLLQYQSLKHLDAKNNASFEIGMLAGFESYTLDIAKRKNSTDQKPEEFEETVNHVPNESQDYHIVKKIIEAYKAKFDGKLPPHPKQSVMEQEIVQQLEHADKSLIFVRRVASAYELQERLIESYAENVVYEKQLKKLPKNLLDSDKVKDLITEYEDRKIDRKLFDLFEKLSLSQEIKKYLIDNGITALEKQASWVHLAYKKDNSFNEFARNFILKKKKNIPDEIKTLVLNSLSENRDIFLSQLLLTETESGENTGEPTDETEDSYFFASYFKRNRSGYSYKAKMYREIWFDIDILAFNKHLSFLSYNENQCNQEKPETDQKEPLRKHQVFQNNENETRSFLEKHAHIKSIEYHKYRGSSTFLTDLLTGPCKDQMQQWISKRTDKGVENLLENLKLLETILKNIFRNGSGLLAGFIADSSSEKIFSKALLHLLIATDAPFHSVLKEVQTIITDFDLILSSNFDTRDETKINNILNRASSPVIAVTGRDRINKGILAAQFRMPGFPYCLVTTDIFREGEDLHTYCQNIYHYGIAWNPSDMEQRTGRIDRINSQSYRKLHQQNTLNFDNKVHVFYPYMSQSVEINQVIKLLGNMDKFTRTFNNLAETSSYESNVSISTTIDETNIPPQIVELLISQYDIWNFGNHQPE